MSPTPSRGGRPVVALESSVLAQGLPIPANREAAERMRAAVGARRRDPRHHGRRPRRAARSAWRRDELERFLAATACARSRRATSRVAMAQEADGATTVAASLCIAGAAERQVFATGGIGGVHRDAPFDESGDLAELARTPMVVVCAGAKSILDLPATLERLETLGVTVVGYRTDELPGFFTRDHRAPADRRAPTAPKRSPRSTAPRGRSAAPQATLVVQPPPADVALPAELVDRRRR